VPEAPAMDVQHVPGHLGALGQPPPLRRVTAISLHARPHSPSHPRARHLPPRPPPPPPPPGRAPPRPPPPPDVNTRLWSFFPALPRPHHTD